MAEPDEEVADDESQGSDYVTADEVRTIITESLESFFSTGTAEQDPRGDQDPAGGHGGHLSPAEAERIAEQAVRKALASVKKSQPRTRTAAPKSEPEVIPADPKHRSLTDMFWGKS